MPKGVPNKRYTGEFKQEVVETMQREKLSHKEVARLYGITAHDRVASWERIYLEEGPEGLYIERRGRGSKGRPPKKLKPEVEEDLLAEVQRLKEIADAADMIVSGYEGKHHVLKARDVVFIDCRKAYSHSTGLNMNAELWSLRWCHFYGPSMPAIYAKYCERGGQPVIRGNDMSQYAAILADIYTLASSSDYIRDMRINEKLNVLLTLLMESSWHRESRANAPKKMEVTRVKSFLDEHYSEKLSLESVASSFFINKHYLARRFKEQYGVTLVTYLQQVRITHAKRMLRFTDKSIEEIGLECGIGELNYFSRVFKKLEGISPSEFRRLW